MQKGVSAIFGPDEKASSIHAADICDTKEMPYIDTRWDPESKMPIVNMYPSPSLMALMLVDLVQASEWTSFTILYESAEWLPRVSELLRMYDAQGSTITVRRLDLKLSVPNYRSVLRRVKLSSDTCIIIECSIDNLGKVLKHAQQVGLMTDQHQFILTNFDSHTINLEPYQYSGTSITTIRLIDPEHQILKEMAEYMDEEQKNGSYVTADCHGRLSYSLFTKNFAEENEEAENGEDAEENEAEEENEETESENDEPKETDETDEEAEANGNAANEDEGDVKPETETVQPEVEEIESNIHEFEALCCFIQSNCFDRIRSSCNSTAKWSLA